MLSHVFVLATSSVLCVEGGYRDALCFRHGHSVDFDTEMFIASRPVTMRPFLLSLLHLQVKLRKLI